MKEIFSDRQETWRELTVGGDRYSLRTWRMMVHLPPTTAFTGRWQCSIGIRFKKLETWRLRCLVIATVLSLLVLVWRETLPRLLRAVLKPQLARSEMPMISLLLSKIRSLRGTTLPAHPLLTVLKTPRCQIRGARDD